MTDIATRLRSIWTNRYWPPEDKTLLDSASAIETLTREKSALEAEAQHWHHLANQRQIRLAETIARAEAAEKALDDLHEKLQAIGEEFGVDGGEERTAGIRRVLTKQKANIADAAKIIRPFARRTKDYAHDAPNSQFLDSFHGGLTIGHLRAARAWLDKHDKGEK